MKRIKLFAAIALLLSTLLMSASCGTGVQKSADDSSPKDQMQNSRSPGTDGLYPAAVSYVGDRKWGYIDSHGAFIIQPVFGYAGDFQPNGLAVAGTNDRVGLIDRKGNYIVGPVYSSIAEFSEGRAVALDSKGFKVIDEKGNVIFETEGFVGNFKDGKAVFYQKVSNGKLLYGYIDTSGNRVIEPKYEYAGDFNDGMAVVKQTEGGYAIIDKSGGILKSFNYYYVGSVHEGLIAFQTVQNGKYGYIDRNGGIVVEPKFTSAGDFRGGMAAVNISEDPAANKYGLIDKKGGYIIKPEYNDVLNLGEGMLAVGVAINKDYPFIGSRYAIAGKEGRILTDFIYYGVEEYKNGAASAFDSNSTFFIDKMGRRVESLPAVKGIGSLNVLDDLVKANIDSRLYYLDRQGKIIYMPSNCAKFKNGAVVCEEKYRPNRNYLVYYPQISGLESMDVQNSINAKLKSMSIRTDINPNTDLDYTYEGGFNLAFYKKNLLVLELTAYNFPFGAAHGMPFMKYAHVDIKKGTFYELKDLFTSGSDYVKVLSDIVGKQIREHGEEMGVWPDSYKGVKPNQLFFVTRDALKVYFQPYEIAPYAAGFPTFTIPFKDIMEIINVEGSFWKAFN